MDFSEKDSRRLVGHVDWRLLSLFFLKFYLFIYLFWLHQVLVVACGIFVVACGFLSCGMHVGSSPPTRDQTRAPCVRSAESYPLAHQGTPSFLLLTFLEFFQLVVAC